MSSRSLPRWSVVTLFAACVLPASASAQFVRRPTLSRAEGTVCTSTSQCELGLGCIEDVCTATCGRAGESVDFAWLCCSGETDTNQTCLAPDP